jgi:hypothetical protein
VDGTVGPAPISVPLELGSGGNTDRPQRGVLKGDIPIHVFLCELDVRAPEE